MKGTSRKRQSGLALLVVVAALALGGTFLVLSSLNAATWRAERYRVTQAALAAAKEALIARAVADADRPGSLPCPDTNDDGSAELFVGNACPSYVGRLPWRTLGASDLRDGSGERLWYVLSPTHRDDNSAEPINSDTAAQLTLTGVQPAGNALAVVLAPGSPLIRSGAAAIQDRSCIVGTNCDAALSCTTVPHSITPKCNPFSYLDLSGGVDNADGDNILVSAAEDQTFNDRALPILADDVMPLVERRAGRELAQNLRDHYDAWQSAVGSGFYPWAAPFLDPAATPTGTPGTVEGLLPSSTAAAVWSTGSANLGCAGVGTNVMVCSGLVWPGVIDSLNVSGTVNDIGRAFFNAPAPSDVSASGLTLIGTPVATWTVNGAAQRLEFSYSAPALAVGIVTLTLRAPAASAWTTSSWLARNRWSEVAYYALSPNFAVDGNKACGTCVSVSNVVPALDREAIVVTTGRSLAGQRPRPVAPLPALLADYLEGNNVTTDFAFERAMRSAAFNDQPTVVRP